MIQEKIDSPSRTLFEVFSRWERERREYQCLNPNGIWFQRHEKNPNLIAQICLVSNRYRWQLFDGKSNYPCAQGNGSTLSKSKRQVLEIFRRRG